MPEERKVCKPMMLPQDQWVAAARTAATINPLNHAPVERLRMVMPEFQLTPERLAVVISKYWGAPGVQLTVGFMDNPSTELKTRILSHMNSWSKTANVKFVETTTDPQVRISRTLGPGVEGGYWSYLGTDILHIPLDRPTMMLEDFTMETDDSEFHRVVRHETGHTLGFPHEHMRRELVEKIDPAKAIAYFKRTQGWDEDMVRRQVLTPIEDSSLWGSAHADPYSIMCYQISGELTTDGYPIVGGRDITDLDYDFIAQCYPLPHAGPPPRLTFMKIP